MMAEPSRYREVMYDLFFLGKEPTLTPEERKRVQAKNKGAKGGAPTQSELAALQALRDRAAKLREQQNN
jgi:hypothetical protein